MPKLTLTSDPEADQLLSSNPLALLIGMLLDQQGWLPPEGRSRTPPGQDQPAGRAGPAATSSSAADVAR